jgi:hypothetical protein
MAIIFIDSFQHYNALATKWSSGLGNFNTNPAFIRTPNALRTQSLLAIGGSFNNLPRINFTLRFNMTVGVAYYQSNNIGNQIMFFYNQATAGQLGQINVLANGAIQLTSSQGILATSASGLIGIGQFYYIEQQSVFQVAGSCSVRVNGQTVLTFNGDMTAAGGSHPGADGFLLPGSAINNCYYNDLYLLDSSGSTNNTFLGAVLIYALPTKANETPLNFTPLANTNWQEVNAFPPQGDTAYVSSSTVGAIDQYEYDISGIPGVYQIKGIQHCMSAKLDSAGSHTLFSQLNATTGQTALVGSNAPGAVYDFVLCPYDQNPNTSAAFQPSDFTTTFLGPNITS